MHSIFCLRHAHAGFGVLAWRKLAFWASTALWRTALRSGLKRVRIRLALGAQPGAVRGIILVARARCVGRFAALRRERYRRWLWHG